jgi:hypothetical protein
LDIKLGDREIIQNYVGGNLKKRVCTRDLRVDGKLILMWTLKKWALSPELDRTDSGRV